MVHFHLQMIASRYAVRVSWLKQLLGHMDFDTRESAARLLGIASGALPNSALPDLVNELISSVAGAQKLRFVLLFPVKFAIYFEVTITLFLTIKVL